MAAKIRKQDVQKLVGKEIYAMRKDGSVIHGKLVRISGNTLIVSPKGKQVRTSAILPLALFDLLAIGTAPFAFGGPFGFGGFGPFGGFGGFGGFGPFGGFW